jgi:hypothetical protein
MTPLTCVCVAWRRIVDRVHVPTGLAPGAYVLGWRWDAEESNQVWSSCSDVQIVAPRRRA